VSEPGSRQSYTVSQSQKEELLQAAKKGTIDGVSATYGGAVLQTIDKGGSELSCDPCFISTKGLGKNQSDSMRVGVARAAEGGRVRTAMRG